MRDPLVEQALLNRFCCPGISNSARWVTAVGYGETWAIATPHIWVGDWVKYVESAINSTQIDGLELAVFATIGKLQPYSLTQTSHRERVTCRASRGTEREVASEPVRDGRPIHESIAEGQGAQGQGAQGQGAEGQGIYCKGSHGELMRKIRRLGGELLERRVLMHGDPLPTAADVDGDGEVNIFDLNIVASNWGTENPVADVNHDGTVDNFDLAVVSTAWGKLPHGDSQIKQDEHLALLATFPRTAATDIAVADGDWNDPAVWYDGTVPTAGEKVLILAEVSFNADDTANVSWIRVEDELAIHGGTLQVGTLFGTPSSHLEMDGGTVQFYGTVDDPYAFSIGMVWHGTADIHGSKKASYTFAKDELAAGETEIQVDHANGWQVGDKLVIAGTSLDYRVNEDDVRYVTAVTGNKITLDAALAFAHLLVDGHPPVIENLTRSVTFRTAAGSPDRGHVMFMHNPAVTVAYAAFENLGRTDKTRDVTTPDGLGGGLDNPIGRYALHFHRTGAAVAASVVGNAIDGSPGWGLVNHESYVNADNNVSYNVVGAHYVTESGNELGRFQGNVAVRSHGDKFREPNDKLRDGMIDFGTGGDGFWMESGLTPLIGNIMVGLSHTGIFEGPGVGLFDMRLAENVFFQDPDGNPINLSQWFQENNVGDRLYPNVWRFPNSPTSGPEDFHLEYNVGFLPFRVADNFVHGSAVGMIVMGYRSSPDYDAQIVGNTFVGPSGMHLNYSNRVNIENNRILSGTEAGEFRGRGISHNGGSTAIHYENNTVVGFEVGLVLPVLNDIYTGEINTLDGGYYDNGYTNLLIHNTYTYGRSGGNRTIEINDPVFGDSAKYNIEMNIGFFTLNINRLYAEQTGPNYGDYISSIDPLFTEAATGRYTNTTRYDGQRLYFAEQATDFAFGELLDNEPYDWTQEQRDYMQDLRHNDDGSFTTTGDLAAEGLNVGGVALPEGEQYFKPKVKGVFVRD